MTYHRDGRSRLGVRLDSLARAFIGIFLAACGSPADVAPDQFTGSLESDVITDAFGELDSDRVDVSDHGESLLSDSTEDSDVERPEDSSDDSTGDEGGRASDAVDVDVGARDIETECEIDDDCSAGPCFTASCVMGTCKPSFISEGTPCPNPCAVDPRCNATGGCVGQFGCDDGLVCTVDDCVAAEDGPICSHTVTVGCLVDDACIAEGVIPPTAPCSRCVGGALDPLPGGPCDDGDACTTKDGCAGGSCVGDAACDDGLACTTDDTCAAGQCVGTMKACDDGSTCTLDVCVETPNGPTCLSAPAPDSCVLFGICYPHGAAIGDCEQCESGAVVPTPGLPCDDASSETFLDECDSSGTCLGTPCDCGKAYLGCALLPCDEDGSCLEAVPLKAGQCAIPTIMASATVYCFDSGQESVELSCKICNPTQSTTTWSPNVGAECDDYNCCTEGDFCNEEGECVAGAQLPEACDDGEPCTDDFCDPASCIFADGSACFHQPTTDGTACEGQCGAGVCQDLSCLSCECESDADCTPPTSCTTVSCVQGLCVPEIIPECCESASDCDDCDDCTTDGCSLGTCTHYRVPSCCRTDDDCEEFEICGDTFCDTDGQCRGKSFWCDDGNPCTWETCDPKTGCHFEELPPQIFDGQCYEFVVFCEDFGEPCVLNACSIGTCVFGVCRQWEELPCDDGDSCTIDLCDPKKGCHHRPMGCSDGHPGTIDECVLGECIHSLDPTPPYPCDDGLNETIDQCLKGTCVYDLDVP
jgi:hypothetical protein